MYLYKSSKTSLIRIESNFFQRSTEGKYKVSLNIKAAQNQITLRTDTNDVIFFENLSKNVDLLEAQLLSDIIDCTDSIRQTVTHGTFSYFGHISVVVERFGRPLRF